MEEKLGVKGKIEVLRFQQSFDTILREQIAVWLKNYWRHKYEVIHHNMDKGWAENYYRTMDQHILSEFPELASLNHEGRIAIVGGAKITADRIFAGYKEYDKDEGDNIIVDVGANLMLNLICGSGTSFSNANAQCGVGNSATTPDNSDTDLLGGSKLFVAVDSNYPSVTSRQMVAQSTFGDAQAKFHWYEEALRNGTTILNRSNTDLGDKSGVTETWLARLTFTG